jgi:hypothetical protein
MSERTLLQAGVGAGQSQAARSRQRPHVAVGLLGLALAWATPSVAEACYCAAPELESSIDSADVIFEGMTALEPEEIRQDIGLGVYGDVQTSRYDFEVLRYYKADGGSLPPEVALHTPAQAPACGRTFDKSQVYLIYARVREDGLLVDFRCSRTRSFERADEDLLALGEGVAPDEGAVSELTSFDAESAGSLEASGVSAGADVDAGLAGGCSQANGMGNFAGSLSVVGIGVAAALLRRRRARDVAG